MRHAGMPWHGETDRAGRAIDVFLPGVSEVIVPPLFGADLQMIIETLSAPKKSIGPADNCLLRRFALLVTANKWHVRRTGILTALNSSAGPSRHKGTVTKGPARSSRKNMDQMLSAKTTRFYSMHPDSWQSGAGKCGDWE